MEKAPWTEHARLADVVAAWRGDWTGRELFAVTAGRHWVRLHFAGDDKAGLLLTDQTGARLALAVRGRLPEPLHRQLAPERSHPLRALLADCRLTGLGLLPEDRVLACALTRPDGGQVVLLHRMFGARGDTVLVDAEDRLLWARRRPPHDLLTRRPPPATWSTGTATGDDLSAPALHHLAGRLAGDLARAAAAVLERRRQAARRLARNLASDLETAARGEEIRRQAEALAAHLHELAPGAAEARLDDPRDGTPLVLALDPALTPAANLEAWFRRARKAERGRQIIADRLAAARGDLASLDAAAADLAAADGTEPELDRLAALQQWRDDHPELQPSAAPARGRHTADEPARPFRRYLIDDRWEVWVGRSNLENDELTHRASHGKDLWLHAQGVPGSHVILRTGGRPERVPGPVVAKAARLAALHSKARHSGLVPVIWTERRHVRRPRKSPPGTAVCQREKSLMVEPGVAAGVTGA